MTRITILSPDPANGSGGVERMSSLLAQTIASEDRDVTIVAPTRAPARWQFRTGLAYPAVARSALAAAQATQPDLIVTNGYLGGSSGRVPRVHVFHGTMLGGTRAVAEFLPKREAIRRALSAGATEALAGRGAARIVCVSDATAEEVRRYYRLHATDVLPNGVDTEMFAPRDKASARIELGLEEHGRYAAFVGRFEPGKGGPVALAAARGAGFELLVAGPNGPDEARLFGTLAPQRLASIYAAADCLLLPTRYEACSLVVLEALATGTPVITTAVGWMNTLLASIPSYRALCAEPKLGPVQERLQALEFLDTRPLVDAARAFVARNNSLRTWTQRWRAIVEETLAGASASRPPVPASPSRPERLR